MLVIRRRAGESFLIGEDIEIEVLEVGATQVKLGIAAPKEITVLRSEVRQTQQANRAAANQGTPEFIEDLVKKLRL